MAAYQKFGAEGIATGYYSSTMEKVKGNLAVVHELDLKPLEEDKTAIYERWAKIKDAYEKRLKSGKPLSE